MQITTQHVTKQTNFVPNETVKMGFHAEASGFLLNNLIKQYKDPYTAAFREVTSNALDSHVKVAQTKPVEVTLPSDLSPALIIQDFGIGLTREELRGFGQFGKSDKRDSNEYIGGFGLGSKSPLAMSSSFTVTSVKDGKRNTVEITRAEDGSPVMEFPFPEQDATGIPNGVKITIPTMEAHRYRSLVQTGFFLGWKPGTILIDGEDPTEKFTVYNLTQFAPLDDSGTLLGWRVKKGVAREHMTLSRNQVTALVGGVRYTLDSSLLDGVNRSLIEGFLSEIVLNLDNGKVEIHPSRESLIYDAPTRGYIKERIKALITIGQREYQADIDNAATLREALQIRKKAMSFGFTEPYTYKGKAITTDFNYNDPHAKDTVTLASIRTGRRYSVDYESVREVTRLEQAATYQLENIFAENRTTILVFAATAPQDVRGRKMHTESSGALIWARAEAERITAQVQAQSQKIGTGGAPATPVASLSPGNFHFYFTSLRPKHLPKWWVQAFSQIVKAEDFTARVTELRKESAKQMRLATKAAAPKTPQDAEVRVLSYSEYGRSSMRSVKVADLDATKTHVLLQNGASDLVDSVRGSIMTQTGYDRNRALASIMGYLAKSGKYVFVLANKNAKTAPLVASLPNFTDDIKTVIETHAKSLMKQRSEIEKRAYLDKGLRQYNWVDYMPTEKIDLVADKTFRKWIRAIQGITTTAEDEFVQEVANNATKYGLDVKLAAVTSTYTEAPAAAYPLLREITSYRPTWDALIEYINVMHAAKAAAPKPTATASVPTAP